jgi:hypothetical protein
MMLLLPLLVTQTLPTPSIERLDGKLRPVTGKFEADAPSGAILVMLSFVEFATHAFPVGSMAIAEGELILPAVYPAEEERAAPIGENSLTELVAGLAGEFATQTLPELSTAIAEGLASPPPV